MAISCFCLQGAEYQLWLKHVLHVCQGFIAKKPGWSPIRELATSADTYTQSVSAVECTDRATSIHKKNCITITIFYKYVKNII